MFKLTLPMTALTLLAVASAAWGQQAQPATPTAPQLNLQVLAETLRAAATFHDFVKNLDVQKNLNLSSGTGTSTDSLNRTAAILGAGAGAGAAIGELKGGQKAILIGVVAGAAGALVIDQVIRHKEAKPEIAPESPLMPEPRGFKSRTGNAVP